MWLQLIISLPTENATVRQRSWRALKASGAAVFRDGVYLMPDTPHCRRVFDEIAGEVTASDGKAWILRVEEPEQGNFSLLFDRSQDYVPVMQEITALSAQLASATSDSIGNVRKQARKLHKVVTAIASIDFFPGAAKEQAEAALQTLQRGIARIVSPDEPHSTSDPIRRLARDEYQGRLWATRQRPWVDRLASAWLIRRFVDASARFMWLPHPADCPPEAVGFDFDGANFTHVDNRVTFEVMLTSFGLEQAALIRLGALVHYLDVGGVQPAEATGIETVLAGLRSRIADDDLLLIESFTIFDSLYAAFQAEHASYDAGT